MLPNINITPNSSTSTTIGSSRAHTFLDSYIYMKNQRYNALYEKNKKILAIENNAISISSANMLYNAFIEEVRILDSIIMRIRNFTLRIKPDVIENINILLPSNGRIALFDEAITSNVDIERKKCIKYNIQPITYENMASFMNLYKIEIKNFMDINTNTSNKENPFFKNKATKYLIEMANQHSNLSNELLEMENVIIINKAKLKNISSFFKHKGKFIQTLTRDFKTFQFYLRQYTKLKDLALYIKPTEMINGKVRVGDFDKLITFNDYFIMYKHFDNMVKYMVQILAYHEAQFFNKIYALQSNIEIYTTIMNEVLDKYKKILNEENKELNESILLNKEDIYYNKDKFDSGEINLCFITGHSGSGKSTLGKDLSAKGVEHYELDDLQCVKDHFTLNNLKEYGDLIYNYFTGPGKDLYLGKEDIKNISRKYYEDKLYPGFVKYAMEYAKSHKDKKIIIEGIELFGITEDGKPWFKESDFDNYAFYIKGTSMLISKFRAAKRDSLDAKNYLEKNKAFSNNFMFRRWKIYLKDESLLKRFINYFKNKEQKSLNESSSVKRVNDKGEKIPEKCTKCGNDIKLFLQGEPVWLCENKDCKKYYGTLPCNLNEAINTNDWQTIIGLDYEGGYPQLNEVEDIIKDDDSLAKVILDESKSILNKNHKQKGNIQLSDLKRVHIAEEVINKYKSTYPLLKHVRCKDTNEYTCDGYMWLSNNELVCVVGSCEYTDDHTKWIVSLEVIEKYKGYGLSKQLVDYAVKNMNCSYLSVNKNNEIAKKVYDEYGFKTYQEDKNMYYMKLNESCNIDMMQKDSIKDVSEESISNFSDNDLGSEEVFTVCTLRDSLNV